MIFLISLKSKKSISLILAKNKLKSVIQTNTFIVAKNLNFVNALHSSPCHFGFKSEQFCAIFGFKSEQNILAVFK